jgi:hypothetical protein
MNMRSIPLLVLALVALAFGARAETLYKLIDKKGRVTYVQDKPKDFDGQVVPVEIDLKANTATMPKYTPPAKAEAPKPAAAASRDALALARARVERAQNDFDQARNNPGPDDVRFVANAGGKGTRPVPSEDYLQRLARLENELADARADLRKLQGGR